jgi:hypothetical protein
VLFSESYERMPKSKCMIYKWTFQFEGKKTEIKNSGVEPITKLTSVVIIAKIAQRKDKMCGAFSQHCGLHQL